MQDDQNGQTIMVLPSADKTTLLFYNIEKYIRVAKDS
jgi:hypothetical protein